MARDAANQPGTFELDPVIDSDDSWWSDSDDDEARERPQLARALNPYADRPPAFIRPQNKHTHPKLDKKYEGAEAMHLRDAQQSSTAKQFCRRNERLGGRKLFNHAFKKRLLRQGRDESELNSTMMLGYWNASPEGVQQIYRDIANERTKLNKAPNVDAKADNGKRPLPENNVVDMDDEDADLVARHKVAKAGPSGIQRKPPPPPPAKPSVKAPPAKAHAKAAVQPVPKPVAKPVRKIIKKRAEDALTPAEAHRAWLKSVETQEQAHKDEVADLKNAIVLMEAAMGEAAQKQRRENQALREELERARVDREAALVDRKAALVRELETEQALEKQMAVNWYKGRRAAEAANASPGGVRPVGFKGLCVLCATEIATFGTKACGHVIICGTCKEDTKVERDPLCPICRAPHEGYIKTSFAGLPATEEDPVALRKQLDVANAMIFDQESEIFYMEEQLQRKDAEIADWKAKGACA